MRKIQFTLAFLFLMIIYCSSDANAQTQRISFKRGANQASVRGTLVGNGSRTFVLSAKQGQMMRAEIVSRGSSVKFQEGESATVTIWQTETAGGNNYLYIQNNSSRPANFTLFVTIR